MKISHFYFFRENIPLCCTTYGFSTERILHFKLPLRKTSLLSIVLPKSSCDYYNYYLLVFSTPKFLKIAITVSG